MILPAQAIRILCNNGTTWKMLDPFCERTVHPETGMSYGLSSAGYDVRVAQDVNLKKGDFLLASTIEHVHVLKNMMVFVKDKSSLVRRGLTVQNTVLEPGWSGYTTLELIAHKEDINLPAGAPIAQFIFCQLLGTTEQPYSGKYQNQPPEPVPALRETS